MKKVLSTNAVCKLIPVDRTTLFKWFKEGAPHPAPIVLHQVPHSRGMKMMLWTEADIANLREWRKSRKAHKGRRKNSREERLSQPQTPVLSSPTERPGLSVSLVEALHSVVYGMFRGLPEQIASAIATAAAAQVTPEELEAVRLRRADFEARVYSEILPVVQAAASIEPRQFRLVN